MNSVHHLFSSYEYNGLSYYTFLFCILFFITMCLFYLEKFIWKKSDLALNVYSDALIDSYHPEPLYSVDNHRSDKLKELSVMGGIVKDKLSLRMNIEDKWCLNLATSNFLNILGNPLIEAKSIEIIKKYGVGSCGPRGFYGTVDVHLELENRIARFMKMEEAIVYSYGFSTVASTIPAYCKQQDIIFCDSMISHAAKSGIVASRSKCIFFEHNDAEDLEYKIKQYISAQKKDFIPKERRFLILEGICGKTGEICDLPKMVDIKKKYNLRLFLDESYSLGVLGKTGRGVIEHFNINRSDIDLVSGSLETLIGSVGGFCVGSHFIIEHQRLSGLGYCFSASLPPVLAYAAIAAFDYMDENSPEIFDILRQRSMQVHKMLEKLPSVILFANVQSPIKYLEFTSTTLKKMPTQLTQFVEECYDAGVLVASCSHNVSQKTAMNGCIKICVNVTLGPQDIDTVRQVLLSICKKYGVM